MKKPTFKEKEIDVTSEYGVFERMPGNRAVDEVHVIKLMEAMRSKDLFVPIIVNTNFEIIDGQHRLEARKRLGLAVPYVVAGNYGLADVQILNARQKKWSIDDFVKSYIELGKKDYEIYQWFRKQYNLPHGVVVALLSKTPLMSSGTHRQPKETFNTGNFKVVDLMWAKGVAEDLLKIQPHFDHWNNRGFVAALMFCLSKKAFDFKKFLSKLENNPVQLKPCANTDLYIQHIETLYNYRSQEKVSLRYGEDK